MVVVAGLAGITGALREGMHNATPATVYRKEGLIIITGTVTGVGVQMAEITMITAAITIIEDTIMVLNRLITMATEITAAEMM